MPAFSTCTRPATIRRPLSISSKKVETLEKTKARDPFQGLLQSSMTDDRIKAAQQNIQQNLEAGRVRPDTSEFQEVKKRLSMLGEPPQAG